MKKRNVFRLKIISLICALLLLVFSAIPLFNKSADAGLLLLIFSAFGSGVMLSNLIHNVRKEKRKGNS